MRERTIELYLKTRVEAWGGRCLKFVSPGRRGVVDRIVQWPKCYRTRRSMLNPGALISAALPARTHYVETKAPGKKPRPEQLREHAWLRRNGFDVFVLDTKAKVDRYVRRHG